MDDRTLLYPGIEKTLLARFPELSGRVEQAFGSYYDLKTQIPKAYPIFEDVLQKLIFDLLKEEKTDPLLSRIFAFLEEMAKSPDRDVTDLLGIAVLEPLVFNRESIRRAWKYMGSKTRTSAMGTARAKGWEENLPVEAASGENGHREKRGRLARVIETARNIKRTAVQTIGFMFTIRARVTAMAWAGGNIIPVNARAKMPSKIISEVGTPGAERDWIATLTKPATLPDL
jgi:hypothetical protein